MSFLAIDIPLKKEAFYQLVLGHFYLVKTGHYYLAITVEWVNLSILALVNLPLIGRFLYSLFFRKEDWIEKISKYYRKLLLPKVIALAFGGYIVLMFARHQIEECTRTNIFYSLFVAGAAVAFTMGVFAIKMFLKLKNWRVAYRRAAYAYSVEYAKAFWLGLIFYAVFMLRYLEAQDIAGFLQQPDVRTALFNVILPLNAVIYVPIILLFPALALVFGVFPIGE